MAKKILSFEEYQVQLKSEQEAPETTEEITTEEEVEEVEDESTEETEEESDEESVEDSEEESEDDDDDEDDDDEDDDDEDDDDEDDDESEEESEEVTVESMLSEGYAKVKEAACAYEKDDYQDHTLEGYMKENAALVATLAAQAMEEAYGEVKEGELTQEMYEAACNEMKEAYVKKIDELKEAWGAGE